jgi:hypothetical protein
MMSFDKLRKNNIKWILKVNGINNEVPLNELGI